LKISDCGFAIGGAIGFAMAVIASGAGCAAPEQSLLEQFFGASRLRDTTALQGVSTITFEPLQQGIVRTFQITGVTPEHVDGETVAKDVTVDAPVILPDGETVRKTLVVTLRRNSSGDSYRWMVTGVKDAAALRRAPPS
jgi:hypothetical protein